MDVDRPALRVYALHVAGAGASAAAANGTVQIGADEDWMFARQLAKAKQG